MDKETSKNKCLKTNTSAGYDWIDLVSNGIKIETSDGVVMVTHIYWAWALVGTNTLLLRGTSHVFGVLFSAAAFSDVGFILTHFNVLGSRINAISDDVIMVQMFQLQE